MIKSHATNPKDAKFQAGGLAEISRGLSGAIPPEGDSTGLHSEGVPEVFACRANTQSLRPFQGRVRFVRLPGVSAALRLPQPPANFCQPSGLKTARQPHPLRPSRPLHEKFFANE